MSRNRSNVSADCAKCAAQAAVSLFVREKNAGGGGARDCDVEQEIAELASGGISSDKIVCEEMGSET